MTRAAPIYHELRGGRPQYASYAVNAQKSDRLPDFERIGQEQHAPGQRAQHVQHHPDMDDAARIEAVGERAGMQREQQERQPVRDHRVAAEGRRVEFLEHHPPADHVLDRVGHHREHRADEIRREAGRPQRRESAGRLLCSR